MVMQGIRIPFIAGMVAALVSLGVTTGQAQDGEAGVKAAVTAYAAAFNTGNADRFAQFWATDADYTTNAGEHYRGRDAIQSLMAAEAEGLKGTKLEITDVAVRMLKPDVALQDGVLQFTNPDGLVDRSRYSAVWSKNGKEWQLASVRDLGPLPTVEAPEERVNPLSQLDALTGEWSAADDAAKVELKADWKLGRNFLEFQYLVTPKAGEPFTVLQLIGWDPIDETVRSWFFDSAGGHGSGIWDKTETGWSVLSSGATPGGQIGGGVYDYSLNGKTMTLKITSREVAGQPLPDTEVKFTKK